MTIAPVDKQLNLFYIPPMLNADSVGGARNAYGIAVQEIVVRQLNLNPIRTNGNFDICLDAEKNGTYYEIKSCRKTGKVVVYKWRLEKEQASGLTIQYVILVHNLKGARTDIFHQLNKAGFVIATLPLALVVELTKILPLRKHKNYLGKRNGYSRKEYRDGYYNIPIKDVLQQAQLSPVG